MTTKEEREILALLDKAEAIVWRIQAAREARRPLKKPAPKTSKRRRAARRTKRG